MRKSRKQQTSDTALTDEELIEKYGDAAVDFRERITVIVTPESQKGGWHSPTTRKKKKKDK